MDRILLCVAPPLAKIVQRWLEGDGFVVDAAPDPVAALQLLVGAWNRGQLPDAVHTDSPPFVRMVRDAPAPVRTTPIVYRGSHPDEVERIANIALGEHVDLLGVSTALRKAIALHRQHPPQGDDRPEPYRTERT